ncbi:MAG: hypothetical protein J1E64_04320 [Acetatifactor sp.]|nr:hypothetical protein [Acetatifactor sp.]
MAEYKYEFKVVDDQSKVNGSKICNIIDGFPLDYSEQKVLIYGKLKTLFGDPLYEEKDYENQYTYDVVTTTEDGKEIFLYAYNGPSGPAIGGQQNEESRKAAYQLIDLILQATPTDYDYVGYYLDGPSKIQEGIKNGVPYYDEEELGDLSKEEMDKIFREVTGKDI